MKIDTVCENNQSSWRNWIARETSNLKVVGSSPTGDLRYNVSYRLLSSVGRAQAF